MTGFSVRHATLADVPLVVRHRVGMFTDMGQLPAPLRPRLEHEAAGYLETAIPSGEYVGWLAAPDDQPDCIVAGAGLQRRRILPRPLNTSERPTIGDGREGVVLNVYTEPAWRRRGLARLLMTHVLDWVRASDLDTLVLHASADGRALYEELGFVATNEMRYQRPLR